MFMYSIRNDGIYLIHYLIDFYLHGNSFIPN